MKTNRNGLKTVAIGSWLMNLAKRVRDAGGTAVPLRLRKGGRITADHIWAMCERLRFTLRYAAGNETFYLYARA